MNDRSLNSLATILDPMAGTAGVQTVMPSLGRHESYAIRFDFVK